MSTAILLLARTGDLVNALGFIRDLHAKGEDPHLIVSGRFTDVLSGVSYVKPVSVHFPPNDISKAAQFAEGKFDKILLAQTYGKHWTDRRDHSYNLVGWLNCGYSIEQFHDLKNFPLVFDRRDRERENFLLRTHTSPGKPLMLMCVGCGRSSPFASHYVFTEAVKRKWSTYYTILDLCRCKASRIFDLLGLFEAATLLITGDTAALHLAAAVPQLPVIALVNNIPFQATCPRGPVLGILPYNAVLKNMAEIHGWIGQALSQPR